MTASPLRVVSDDDQVLFSLQRDNALWSRFSQAFGGYVEAIARKIGVGLRATDADRQDAVQETFLFLIDPRRPRYQPELGSAKTYLYYAVQTAFHVVLDHRRVRERVPEHDDVNVRPTDATAEEAACQPDVAAYENRELVEVVCSALTPDARDLLEAVADDRTVQDLSAARGVSRPTMSRMISRVRARARELAVCALGA